MPNPNARPLILGATASLLLAGCSGVTPAVQPPPSTEPSSPPSTPAPPEASPQPDRFLSVVAHARPSRVGVFRSRSAKKPFVTLSNPTEVGAPLVFLVTEERVGWVKVLLPIRPNGSRGWLRIAEVELLEHRFRVEVDLGAHRITVTEGAKTILKAPVGIGTQDTPPPAVCST